MLAVQRDDDDGGCCQRHPLVICAARGNVRMMHSLIEAGVRVEPLQQVAIIAMPHSASVGDGHDEWVDGQGWLDVEEIISNAVARALLLGHSVRKAAEKGDAAVVEHLLSNGADINAQD